MECDDFCLAAYPLEVPPRRAGELGRNMHNLGVGDRLPYLGSLFGGLLIIAMTSSLAVVRLTRFRRSRTLLPAIITRSDDPMLAGGTFSQPPDGYALALNALLGDKLSENCKTHLPEFVGQEICA